MPPYIHALPQSMILENFTEILWQVWEERGWDDQPRGVYESSRGRKKPRWHSHSEWSVLPRHRPLKRSGFCFYFEDNPKSMSTLVTKTNHQCIALCNAMHYGAAVKLIQKWPTLTHYFSMNFNHRDLIFVGEMGKHLICLKKQLVSKNLVKRFVCKINSCEKDPQVPKKWFKVWKMQIHKYLH